MNHATSAATAPVLDRLGHLVASALAIPEGSGARALRMLTLIFSMSGALVMMKAAQSGLFLAAFPRSAIPWAFAASAVTLALTSSLLVVLAPRMGTARLARATVAGAAAALVALYFLLGLGSSVVHFLLYVVIEAASGVLVIQVWSVASAATDARSARKLMPIAGIGAGLAWTFFGLLVRPLSRWVGSAALLLVAPLLLLLCMGLIRAMTRYDLVDGHKRRARTSLLEGFRDGFRFVGSQPLMRLLAALALLSLVIEQFMDFHLMSMARATYGEADAISSFFGTYFAVTSLISLLLLAGPAGRMLGSLGASRSLLLFPCLIVGLALVAILVPGLTTAVLLRGCARVLKQSIWSNSTEQLHTPLSGVRRAQARSAIRGVLAPGGYAATALLLAALPADADPRVVAGFALLTAAGMAALIARFARVTYTQALHRAVDQRRWEIGSPRARKTDKLDAETYSAFREELLGADPERAALAAEILASSEGPKSAEVLSVGLRHSSPEVRLTVARGLSRSTGFVGATLSAHVRDEPEALVRLACVRALRAAEETDEGTLAALEGLMDDPDAEVAAAAQVGVLRARLEGEELGQALLPLLAGSRPAAGKPTPGEEDPGSATRELGESAAQSARLREALEALDADTIEARGVQSTLGYILERGDPEARMSAAFAVIRTGALSLLPDVVRLLKDPRTAPPVARALVDLTLTGGSPASASGPDTLAASLSRIASRMARESVAPPAEALVLRLLSHSDADIRRSATQALGQSVRDGRHPALQADVVLPLVQRDATPAYARFSILAGLARDDGTLDWEVDEAYEPLVHELELGIERARQDVLALLLLRGKRRLVSAVNVARRRPSANRDAQVAELLEMDLDPALTPWVVPLFERLSLRERVAAARGLGVLDQAALDDPLCAIVALRDDLLTGVARLCYGDRFIARFSDSVDDSMVPLFEKMRFLRSVPLFKSLAGDDLRRLAEMVDTLEFEAGHVVFETGDPGDALYVVLEGSVAMLQGELELARMGVREFFGELALLDSQPRSADARCLESTRLIRLRGADLDELMTHRPAATREIVRVLAKRLRETGRRVQA